MTIHLPPTPLSTTGAPHPADPELPDRLDHSPIIGKRRVIDDVETMEVTLVAHEPRGREVLVHLNSLTDAIRTRLDPAVMNPIGGTAIQALSWWLSADGCCSYRYWRNNEISRDIGATREDWLRVHREGEPDPLNPETLPVFDLREQPVWRGPDSHPAPWAPAGEAEQRWRLHDGGRFAVLPGDDRTLVLSSGFRWRLAGVVSALQAAGSGHTVVAVGTGEGEQRIAWLTTARGCAPLVERARKLTGAGREVIAVGQSFGGLACVELTTHRPDLVTTVIAQSASLWFAGDPVPDPEAEGTLPRDLTAGTRTLGVPVVVQAGTDEHGLIQGARRLARIAERTGRLVSAEKFRGGHDLSWWRHGLLSGLSALV